MDAISPRDVLLLARHDATNKPQQQGLWTPSRRERRLYIPWVSCVPAKVCATSLSVNLCEPFDTQEVWAREEEIAWCEFADLYEDIEE
jgi:hypothetical protein